MDGEAAAAHRNGRSAHLLCTPCAEAIAASSSTPVAVRRILSDLDRVNQGGFINRFGRSKTTTIRFYLAIFAVQTIGSVHPTLLARPAEEGAASAT